MWERAGVGTGRCRGGDEDAPTDAGGRNSGVSQLHRLTHARRPILSTNHLALAPGGHRRPHTRTHAHTRTRTHDHDHTSGQPHTRTHTHTHARTHTHTQEARR